MRCANCGEEHEGRGGNGYCPRCSNFFAGIGGSPFIDAKTGELGAPAATTEMVPKIQLTGRRLIFEDRKLGLIQRLGFWGLNVWCAMRTMPPTEYRAERWLLPGDPGYDEATYFGMYEYEHPVEYRDMALPVVQILKGDQ